ncbi:hypothetical protein SPRG_02593 [Saprolegnia parasitica CBS 223.65]|uniref:Uncharacterized protein n=1 Tax=Saprolegnia parasitica (strain CBS 223.65) TaxID=695850 RepID=A0A067D1J3_SAPPC|nr:hypothetical protein SPRG_02593 [Saprolegnia parasitica CBS 223.65]KDO32902.1 hypothetical protein SPRG_02593 [Saprolegnia parasitica CBS 223.65]|eukprot:XP_012196552.1 hypothetical protein SPRG_02593 [Saprolegnia parasitica CBS 223.65]
MRVVGSPVHKVYGGDASTNVWPSYARHVLLNELTSIEYAVRQLSASWSMRMAVQHCWVDFNQTFQVAQSTKRQERCAMHFRSDGGVYMESIQRNVIWTEFSDFWGGANGPFPIAIQLPLQESARGRDSLKASPSPASTRAWTTQSPWQNYKRVGVYNAITDTYGVSYLLTLQAPSGVYRLSSQTLLRSSAVFAFANTTPAAMFQQHGTLASPLSARLGARHALPWAVWLDRYGLRSCATARATNFRIVERTRVSLADNLAAQAAYHRIAPLDASFPVPTAWRNDNLFTLDGLPLCPKIDGVAGSITPTRQQLVVAALVAGLPSSSIDAEAVCQGDVHFVYLDPVTSFVHTYYLPPSLDATEVAP